jgi:AcrR family transcriptional regulator
MNDAATKPDRRMGPPGSDNWHAMLDGAEQILRDEGHGALTSRRVAEAIGVKQRLVYYYFRTMDDLITEMFRRAAERELTRLREACASDIPLRALWEIEVHTTDPRVTSEFMALATRIEGLKSEVIHFIEESRRIQIDAIVAALNRSSKSSRIPPAALAMIASSVALALTREEQLGVKLGHDDVAAVIDAFLVDVEPG